MCRVTCVINNDVFKDDDYVFLFRLKDKKFYRNTKLFPWIYWWRWAALYTKSEWKFILENKKTFKDKTERYAFVDLNSIRRDLDLI